MDRSPPAQLLCIRSQLPPAEIELEENFIHPTTGKFTRLGQAEELRSKLLLCK